MMKTNDLIDKYTIKKLNAIETAQYLNVKTTLLNQIAKDTDEISVALAEHGALAYMCLFYEGKRVFDKPLSALQELTIDQLCYIYENYCELCEEKIEQCINETFGFCEDNVEVSKS